MWPTRAECPAATETTQMNEATTNNLKLAKTMAARGFAIKNIRIGTPDGRTWELAAVPAGRGRFADGHWGAKTNAAGGFRLFEIDDERETVVGEHDAIDGDTWTAGEIADYLDAVGQPKKN